MVNWFEVFSDRTFDLVDELLKDPGVVLSFWLMVLRSFVLLLISGGWDTNIKLVVLVSLQ